MDNEKINDAFNGSGQAKEKYSFGAFRRLFLCSAILAAVLTVLRTLSLYFFYDQTQGLIKADSVLPEIVDISTALFICLAVILTLIAGRNKKMPFVLPAPRASVISTGILSGLATVALFAFLMYRGVHESVKGPGLIIWTVMLIFMIPAALYFFKTAISKAPYSRSSAALGFAPVLWAALFLISVYFERNTLLNNTIRVYTQMSLISVMLFFLNEIRFLVGKAKPVLYCAFGNAAIIMLSVSSLPKLICAVLCGIDLSDRKSVV